MFLEPGLGKDNILNFTPKRAENVTLVMKKGKPFLEISRESFIDKFCQKCFKTPGKSTLEIDDIGEKVWTLCDGENTLKDVAHGLEDAFGDRIEPAIPRLLSFIKILYTNRLITWDR